MACLSGLGGLSGRSGEPVVKLSSRHVVKSLSSSSRRHWLFGEACKVGEVGSNSPCSISPGLQVSTSPNHQVSTLCLQVCKYPCLQIRQVIRAGYFAKSARFGKSAPSFHVSKSPSFHVRSPGLQISRSPCLHIPGPQEHCGVDGSKVLSA